MGRNRLRAKQLQEYSHRPYKVLTGIFHTAIVGRVLSEHQLAQLRKAPTEPNRVRKAMELLGLTQEQVAEGIGVTQSHINKIVNGNYVSLPLDTAQSLAGYFGCPTDVLFPSRAA